MLRLYISDNGFFSVKYLDSSIQVDANELLLQKQFTFENLPTLNSEKLITLAHYMAVITLLCAARSTAQPLYCSFNVLCVSVCRPVLFLLLWNSLSVPPSLSFSSSRPFNHLRSSLSPLPNRPYKCVHVREWESCVMFPLQLGWKVSPRLRAPAT